MSIEGAVRLIPPLTGSHSTLADAFDAAARQHGERAAYVDGATGERMSYADWHRRSASLADSIVGRGADPGDVVAIMLPSSIDYAVAFGGAVLAGCIVTGLNDRLGEREVASILERARPAVVLHDSSAFSTSPPAGVAVIGRDELPQLCRHDRSVLPPRRAPTDPAVIIWTSGTTGIPKGAWFDHAAMQAAVVSAGVMSEPYDVKLVSTPFAHAGYMAKLWDQLAWRATLVISPTPWRAADMLRLLVDEQVTVAGGVPTQWAKLLDEPGVGEADLSHLRLGLAATAPAPPELIERVSATIGCPLVVRYAMTESPSITGTEPEDPPEVQFRTVGRPQVGMQVEVVDELGAVLSPGEVGTVRVRGGCVMRGYWGDDVHTRAVLADDGWLTSSDLGWVDAGGNLVLVGRVDDMYIRGGYNVYPQEVEDVLAEHPGVDRAAVVGIDAPVIGEIGVAFVTATTPGSPPTRAELRSWVSSRLASYKAPDRLMVMDSLPLTGMLKIDKLALKRIAADLPDDRDWQDGGNR